MNKVHRCLKQATGANSGPNLFPRTDFLFLTIEDNWDAAVNLLTIKQLKSLRVSSPKEVLWVWWCFSTKDGRKKYWIQLQCLPSRLNKWFVSVGLGPATSPSLGELFGSTDSWASPQMDWSRSSWAGPRNLCFHKPSRWYWWPLKFEFIKVGPWHALVVLAKTKMTFERGMCVCT